MGRQLRSVRPWVAAQLRRGPRTVVLTPITARVGNLLYFWMRAHVAHTAGRTVLVRENEYVGAWTTVWPRTASLSTPRSEIRRTDRLLEVPPRHFQQFGADFTRPQLDLFVRECLLTDDFRAAMDEPGPETLTLNVRRGDYYTDPVFRERYGMDLDGYLRRAVELAAGRPPTRRVVVVSDDPVWCSEHLGWLSEVAPVDVRRGGTPLGHLATLASSSRLVLTNSTFGYWGAYIAGAGPGPTDVVAPDFHVRDVDGGRPWQHDPSWRTVRATAP